MKREDTISNLERFERQQEFERQRKINRLIKREKKLSDLQRQKTEISTKKKELSKNLSNRKKVLIVKDNNILQSGDYNNVDEIFKKVFNEDELNAIYSKNEENKNEEYNFDDQNKDDKRQFFTTQQ